MKKIILIGFAALLYACGGSQTTNEENTSSTTEQTTDTKKEVSEYDPHRGEGKFKDVVLGALDNAKADKGKAIYDMKCQSCHKLTDERLVGPGWHGVTQRRTPAWLLNFITNPDEMLDKDPELQSQLEICLVRMPNQNVADEEAYALVEFMRKNDGVK
ncbi:MAG: cytochrome c [Bacteroidia bacterium]|nr:cytochrome c [Bacteroidia bacterium]MCO5253244.1 cytochrome c [Bacteroidota bacterium]MCZ2130418.1 cytochrome c [Bacteroidia bacterium]